MIVKILSAGTSFKGLGAYLTHDADKEKTAERVAWTHTHNLANDHVLSAIDEMYRTAEDADLLKQEAGIRAGGRPSETVVKHISLNWARTENPTQEHMVETCDEFLRHMKWDEHQAIYVAHQDKAHPHVHIMLNAVHPETGIKLDDGFERRRAQAWALDYERSQGNILCEERLKEVREREPSMTREAWMAFQQHENRLVHDEAYYREMAAEFSDDGKMPRNADAREWKILKAIQRDERSEFFSDGKILFSEVRRAVYREIREEFRERWADYCAGLESGADKSEFADIKSEILRDQKSQLAERRDAACDALRGERDLDYRDLLDQQKEMRAGLRERQALGMPSLEFMDAFAADPPARTAAMLESFREAGRETTAPAMDREAEADDPFVVTSKESNGGLRSPEDMAGNVGSSLVSAIGSLFIGLADGLIAAKQPPRRIIAEPESDVRRPTSREAYEANARQQAERDRKLEDERWYRERQRE